MINMETYSKTSIDKYYDSRREFTLLIYSFHGLEENSICVGGNAESADAGLIEEIKNAIKSALPEALELKSSLPLVAEA